MENGFQVNDNGEITLNSDVKKSVIKGYPELRWTGKRPFNADMFYPAQLKESYGDKDDSGWMNKIFWGDNLQVMGHLLREYRGKVDLIYIDPPFDSKADYKKKIKLKGKEVKNDSNIFEEKQYGDIWTNDEYLQFMYERLKMMWELLSDTGSIYLHCDWHKSHHLRCLLDEVFGPDKLVNEIIWKYESGGIPEKFFSRKHDTIFIYKKTDKYVFNIKSASYPRNICQQCGQEMSKWNNLKKEIDQDGRTYRTIKSNGKTYKYYDDEPILLADVWTDISHIQQKDPQRTNYPTQKPEALIKRFIETFSYEGDLVFDCFMGSGTTQAVAQKLGRRFIGADINLGAVQTTTKRLLNILEDKDVSNKTGFEVYNVNNYDFFRNPVEARDLLIEAFNIEPFSASSAFDGELEGRNVKILPVNRIATKADLNELVSNLPFKAYEKSMEENPNDTVDNITLICMGHEADLAASLQQMIGKYKVDIEVVDILSDKRQLEFKREATALCRLIDGKVEIAEFYPMNLMQKLSFQKEDVEDYRQLVDCIMVDYDYDGETLKPQIIDIPEKNDLVKGIYEIPVKHGRVRIKITDLLSESLEMDVTEWKGGKVGRGSSKKKK